jgi:hypothetical protein
VFGRLAEEEEQKVLSFIPKPVKDANRWKFVDEIEEVDRLIFQVCVSVMIWETIKIP